MKTAYPLLLALVFLAGKAHGIGVQQAFSLGQISVSGEASSGYTEAKLVVRNELSAPVDVDFSTACFLQSNDSQRIGLAYEKSTGSYFLRLQPGETYTLYFSSRCLDSRRSTPSTGVAFTSMQDISQFSQIVNALRNNYTQSGVWQVTDSAGGWVEADPRYSSGGSGGGSVDNGGYLVLSGSIGWSTSGKRINIKASRVSNISLSRISGSLRLRAWATRSRYAGISIRGYVMGTRNLSGVLDPGHYFYNISGSVRYSRPPRGTYWTTVTLEEYTGSGWVIRDYLTFRRTTRF